MSTKVLVPIDNTTLVRDMSTQAVLNTDVEGQSRYRELHRKRTAEIKESVDTKQRLRQIEQELDSIKQLITELSQLKKHV
jgi:hypothetical protein